MRAAVAVLERTDADNVGGVMAAEGSTDFERAVACAMRSRWESGPHRSTPAGKRTGVDGLPGRLQTLGPGTGGRIRRGLRAGPGLGDESPDPADGGLVWFTPAMQVTYRPRSTVKALAKQYLHYGRWRRRSCASTARP